MKTRKFLSLLLTVAMMLALVPTFTLTASAADNYDYIDEDGVLKNTADLSGSHTVTVIDSSNIDTIDDLNGWYVVSGNLTRSTALTISGTAHLILKDDSSLTITASNNNAGVNVTDPNSLTIYAQSTDADMGELNANGAGRAAGIGGGYIDSDTPTSGQPEKGKGGTIIINGGKIIATGGSGDGAGIGAAWVSSCGSVTINGGIVNAIGGGAHGAGIGGAGSVSANTGGILTINGGTVIATGTTNGAGIGGGGNGQKGTLIMKGDAIVLASSLTYNLGSATDTTDVRRGILLSDTLWFSASDEVLIPHSITLPENHQMTIPAGRTLTLQKGTTLTNNGRVINKGTVNSDEFEYGTWSGTPYIIPNPNIPNLTVNISTIGFAGKEWWVIGKNIGGDIDGVYTVNVDSVTLLAKDHNFGTASFNNGGSGLDHNGYNDGNLKDAMETAYNSIAETKEQDLVQKRDIEAKKHGVVGTETVKDQYFWPLSTNEANAIGSSTVRSYGNHWWLRSPGHYAFDAASVSIFGSVFDSGNLVNLYTFALRPAFNLDLTSVLFTSAVSGANVKSSATVGSGLIPAEPDGTKLKFTVLDDAMNLDVSGITDITKVQGGTITIPYENATIGTNHYVSGVLVNDTGAVKYYGKFADASTYASGNAIFSLPADIPVGDYKLKLFTEQANGDYYIDFASIPVEIALTVEAYVPPLGITPGMKVYYGTYPQSEIADTTGLTSGVDYIENNSKNYKIEPIEWRVLQNTNSELFLLSEKLLEARPYHTEYEIITWERSTIRSWLNGYAAGENDGGSNGTDYSVEGTNFISRAFSGKEQAAIKETIGVDNSSNGGAREQNDTDDYIFLLSLDEVKNTGYGFDDNFYINDPNRVAKVTEYAISTDVYEYDGNGDWWLRSPGDDDDLAAYVSDLGLVYDFGDLVIIDLIAIRPAFNLDLTSVLFTSAVSGANVKSSATVGSGLIPAEPDGTKLKFTVLDDAINTPALALAGSTNGMGEISFDYSGATTGTNQYISCVLEDTNGDIVYYGKLADCTDTGDASGDFTLALDGVDKDETYTLKIFGEQANGDYETDFAGVSKNFTLTVDTSGNGTAVCAGGHTPNADDGDCTTAILCETCRTVTTPGNTNHDWSEWEITTDPAITGTGIETRTCKDCETDETRAIYAVTWEADGGTPAPTQLCVNHGGSIPTPDPMTKAGYTFGGWFMDNSFTTAASFPIENVTKTTALYAKWTRQSAGGTSGKTYYTVTFNTNGGTTISSQSVAQGGKAAKPTDPAKEGAAFVGWYSDRALTKEYSFSTAVASNLTLYAKWTEGDGSARIITEAEKKPPFVDVSENDWFYGDVYYVWENSIFYGTTETTFSPNTSMTRAMLVTVLWRINGSPAASGLPFTDVPTEQYYTEAVAWAKANSIVSGMGNGLFAPDAEITREQMVAILWRYAKFTGIDVSIGEDTHILSFGDALTVPEYAASPMQWAFGAGVISGKPGGLLNPKGNATRVEVAAILHRFIESTN